MLFEDTINQIFDDIVDWVDRLEEELPFIIEIFDQYDVDDVLDVGCFTGNHAIALAREGYNVTGIDFSNYNIKTARENLSDSYLPMGVNVKFYRDDFSIFSDQSTQKYDGIMVLGNTLSLASNITSLNEVLESLTSLLSDDGVMIIEVMNFGSTKDNTHFEELKETQFEGDDCIVQRGYFISKGSGTYIFNVLRRNDDKWKYWLKESSTIYPFNKDRLESSTSKVGLEIKSIYSSFDRSKFNPSDEKIVAVLTKN